MAITIDGKEYDETKLDNNVKNSIVQVQNANQQIASLQADLLNAQVLAQHHSNFIKENLPAGEAVITHEGKKEEIATSSASDAVAAAEEEIK